MITSEQLARFGKITIFNPGSGWVCWCEMFVAGEGVKVEIKSERGHTTIEGAIEQCLDRCIACIEELKSNPRLENK